MKTRIELSCIEDELQSSLFEVKTLLDALDIEFISLKVYRDRNRDPEKGHSFITVTKHSHTPELWEIYRLSQANDELRRKIESIVNPKES